MSWTVLPFFAVAIGVALTLTLWPKARSPQCWQFYTWMIAVPSVCWLFLFAGGIHVHETTFPKVQSHNAERASTVDHNTIPYGLVMTSDATTGSNSEPLTNEFEGTPADKVWRPEYVRERDWRWMHGSLIAAIESSIEGNPYADLDEHGRYLVVFHSIATRASRVPTACGCG